jgi:hypothetical protein
VISEKELVDKYLPRLLKTMKKSLPHIRNTTAKNEVKYVLIETMKALKSTTKTTK